MTIDHTSIFVPEDKFKQCLDLYVAALKPLGYEVRMSFGEFIVGLGCDEHVVPGYKTATFWLRGAKEVPAPGFHFAFRAKDRATVDAFHAAALQAGGKDNGAPGLRTYHANYYAAFVIDAAGNNLEVVCHSPA